MSDSRKMQLTPSIQNQQCKNCFYSRKLEHTDVYVQCRYNAPHYQSDYSHWPSIRTQDWCGRWKFNEGVVL